MKKQILALLCVASVCCGAATALEPAASAASFTYAVTNYDNDGTHGVFLRRSSNINDKTSTELLYGTHVDLVCGLNGSAVGPHDNTAWDYVRVLDGSHAGSSGYLSEHWLNTPVGSNQHVPGEPTCGGASSGGTAQKAIAWAESKLGQNYLNGYCQTFVYLAYKAASLDIGSGTGSAANYWRLDPKHYARHTDTLPAVGALVFWGAYKTNAAGHVGIYEGNDQVISTASWGPNGTVVHHFSLSARNRAGYPYLGWLLPS